MLARIMIGAGIVLAIGSVAVAYWLASLGCAMNTTGCSREGSELFSELMRSKSGLVFWAGILIGCLLVWAGKRKGARRAVPPRHF